MPIRNHLSFYRIIPKTQNLQGKGRIWRLTVLCTSGKVAEFRLKLEYSFQKNSGITYHLRYLWWRPVLTTSQYFLSGRDFSTYVTSSDCYRVQWNFTDESWSTLSLDTYPWTKKTIPVKKKTTSFQPNVTVISPSASILQSF